MATRVGAAPLTIRYTFLTLVLVGLLLGGCATSGEKTIAINPPPQAALSTKNALATLLLQMGYRHLGLKDPVTGHYIETVEQFGEYRMAFAATDNEAIQVFVLVESSGKVVLRFSEAHHGPLSEQAEGLFQALADRMTLEFGRDNVTVR